MHQWRERVSILRLITHHFSIIIKGLLTSFDFFYSSCPARECHGAFKCKGDFVDSFAIATLEECIEKCNEVVDCEWFTLEKANDHCILYEECDDQFDCETCASGEKKCAHGYKGEYLIMITSPIIRNTHGLVM